MIKLRFGRVEHVDDQHSSQTPESADPRYPQLADLPGSQPPDFERARRGVVRSVAIWTPAFTLLLAGAVLLLVNALSGETGSWFGFSLLALMSLLSGYSALNAWRDLFADPIETTAQIQRKWRKFDLLIFLRAHYILIARRVFRVLPHIYEEMPEPGGWVYTLHYPHTNALVAWRPLDRDELPHNIQRQLDEEERQLQAEQRRAQAEAQPPDAVDLPTFDRRDNPDDQPTSDRANDRD